MQDYFRRAVANVAKFGDTDIFPFPFENHVFHDRPTDAISLLNDMHADFDGWLAKYPPAHDGALVPVGYTGFRWATQLDPIWNLYLLSLVLSIADKIEEQRVARQDQSVFSYRYRWDEEQSSIFDQSSNWRTFMEASFEKSKKYPFVVICDISEFYSRLGHHRLDNALRQLNLKVDTGKRIIDFLGNFSNTNSFGLPIGGPAARILSELTLNQIDRLLQLEGIPFCRYSDDFHLFANSVEDGFSKLLTLTEKLQRTQGLQLQKSKTRIMSSAEFQATSPFRSDDHDAPAVGGSVSDIATRARSLLQFSIRFDPYSQTADEDYEQLKRELTKFDVIGLLQSELSKSRVHISLARKIVTAIRFLDQRQRDQAVISLLENSELLYPIFSSILMMIKQTFPDLSEDTKREVIERLVAQIRAGSHVMKVELVLAFCVRILAEFPSVGVQEILVRLYSSPALGPLVRRDIILAMVRLNGWYWLSDRRTSFRSMSPSERRAFIVASYSLKDEGKHWRKAISDEFSPFEKLVRTWVSSKVGQSGWIVPV